MTIFYTHIDKNITIMEALFAKPDFKENCSLNYAFIGKSFDSILPGHTFIYPPNPEPNLGLILPNPEPNLGLILPNLGLIEPNPELIEPNLGLIEPNPELILPNPEIIEPIILSKTFATIVAEFFQKNVEKIIPNFNFIRILF